MQTQLLRVPISCALRQAGLSLALPLVVNLALYFCVTQPLKARLALARQARALETLKPALEAALKESGAILRQWRETRFASNDPSMPMQTLQQTAATYGLTIAKLNTGTQASLSANSMPIDMEITGKYGRLAHWISDIEARFGFSIESLSLVPGQHPRDPQLLQARLNALFTDPSAGARSTSNNAQQVQALIQAAETSRKLSQRLVAYDAYFRRNPMQGLIDAEGNINGISEGSNALCVQGIIWSDQKPLVIVDDALYAPGAAIGPYTIEEIRTDGITVKRGEDKLFVPLDRGLQPSATTSPRAP